jgi:hypothetical protein
MRMKPKIDYRAEAEKLAPPPHKEPNKEILEHDRKRQVEVRLLEWVEENRFEEKGFVSSINFPCAYIYCNYLFSLSEEEIEKLKDQKRPEFESQAAHLLEERQRRFAKMN